MSRIDLGSEEALEEVYRRYETTLRSAILRIMNNDAEVDEVQQDIVLHVWNQTSSFSSAKGQLLGWLITIARRRSFDRVRQRSAYQRATTRYELSSVHPTHSWMVDKEVQQNELLALLMNFIGELPLPQGEVVQLVFLEGLTQREIAARLALPFGHKKTRIELGMRKLNRSALCQQAA